MIALIDAVMGALIAASILALLWLKFAPDTACRPDFDTHTDQALTVVADRPTVGPLTAATIVDLMGLDHDTRDGA